MVDQPQTESENNPDPLSKQVLALADTTKQSIEDTISTLDKVVAIANGKFLGKISLEQLPEYKTVTDALRTYAAAAHVEIRGTFERQKRQTTLSFSRAEIEYIQGN